MNRKKLLSLLLSVAMVASLAVPAMAADLPAGWTPADGARMAAGETETGKIVILHTNDVHCQIDQAVKENNETGEKTVTAMGYAGVAAYKAEMEAQYGKGNVTLVDAGDAIQGGPIGTLSKGSYLVDIMNKAGYDLAVPGNHEFDYGMDNFLSLAKEKAEYTYICSNFTDLKGNAVFDAYKVVSYGDVKVGFVGIDTPEAFTKSTPTYFQDGKGNYIYSFSEGNGGKDLYATVQKAVDAAKKDGADYVIAVGHLGENGTTDEWKSSAVAANTNGIDVLVDGHSHEAFEQTVKNKDGKDMLLVQTGTKLANIGKIVIDTATKKITHEQVNGFDGQDEAVAEFVAGINAEFKTVLDEVVATSEVLLTTKDADGNRLVRSGETNLGDLCADAYRVILGGDVAFVNGGGIRADIDAGNITYGQIINVHPYSNEGCLVEVTGQTILDALELGTRLYPEESGGFLQVSGLTYDINYGIPSSVKVNDKNEFEGVEGPYRVSNVMVGDKPLDLEKTYTVASHNYMLKDGGDGFVMFKGSKLLKDCVMLDNKVLIDYIVEELGGKVTAEKYGAAQGRITLVNEPVSDEPVIKTPDEVAGMKAGSLAGKTVILHTNDVHGAVEGYAYIAALRDTYKKAGAEVILADAGDFSQGTTYVSIQKGADAITMMNAAGYDVATLGNHEFDFGYDKLMENLGKAEFKALCADVLRDGKTILDPTYVYTTKSGVKVGFFGLETPETQTKVNPGLIKGVTFLSNSAGKTELYECGQAQVDALKKAGADLVIGLVHLGVDDESAGDGHRSVDLFANTKGIDMLIDGHSHTVMTSGSKGEPIQSTGTKFANIGVVVIDDKTKTIEDNYLVATKVMGKDKDDKDIVVSELPQDKTVADTAKKITERVDSEYGAVFAKSEVELCGVNNPGNRTMETNNGNLITDAMMWNVLKEGGLTLSEEYAVTITNGGGIRAPIKAGDITMKDINTDLPFGNTLAVVYVTGSELLEALEASTFATPGAIGGFPQTAGMKWTVNTGIPYDANKDTYPGSTYYGPASIKRVTIQSINGKDFDPNATYAVITNNFCAAGGDTYYAFKRAYDAGTGFDTGIALDEAVVSYITDELKGVISAEQYGGPQGRLTIINRPADLDEKEWWYDAAIEALDTGLMQGTDKGFDALAEITEATVYQTLYNAAGNTDKAAEGEEWYAPALAWAAEQGLYKAEGEFKDGVINREKTLAILTAYAPNADGLMVGNEKGDMMAQKALTRAELAQVMVRLAGVPTPLAD